MYLDTWVEGCLGGNLNPFGPKSESIAPGKWIYALCSQWETMWHKHGGSGEMLLALEEMF